MKVKSVGLVLKHLFSTVSLFTLHLVEPLLPVAVEGLQTALHVSRARAVALAAFHSVPLSIKIFCKSVGVFFGSLFLCSSWLGHCGVSTVLVTCPDRLSSANSIISLRKIIHNPSHTVWSLILSLLLSPRIYLCYINYTRYIYIYMCVCVCVCVCVVTLTWNVMVCCLRFFFIKCITFV